MGQFRFKLMLDRNASKMLSEVGIGEGQSILDFGCGSGTYTIPAAKLVGRNGRVYALDVSQGALEKLSEENPPTDLPKKEALELEKRLTEKLTKHKYISEVVSIRSSLGQHLRVKIPVVVELRGKKIKSDMTVTSRSDLRHLVIIGRKDLKDFLVDTTRQK